MDALLRPLAPWVTVSTRGSRALPLSTFADVGLAARLDGLDLDLTDRYLARPAAVDGLGFPVRSIWVPDPSLWTGWRRGRGLAHATETARMCAASLVVLRLRPDFDSRSDGPPIVGALRELRSSLPTTTIACIALRPRQLEGGRAHLVQLTRLRRIAEEWSFDIALDLVGPIDPRWEAEAAISRLGARLRLLRLTTEVIDVPPTGRSRVPGRALAAAIDGGHPIDVALVPRAPFWRVPRGAAMVDASATASARLRARYAAVEAHRLADAFPPPAPKHRGQRPA